MGGGGRMRIIESWPNRCWGTIINILITIRTAPTSPTVTRYPQHTHCHWHTIIDTIITTLIANPHISILITGLVTIAPPPPHRLHLTHRDEVPPHPTPT